MVRLLRLVVAGLALSLAPQAQSQSNFPSHVGTLTIFVPSVPGSSHDVRSRLLADELGKQLGTTVRVANSNNRALWPSVVAALPSGYTLGVAIPEALDTTRLSGRAPDQLDFICGAWDDPYLTVVAVNSPHQTYEEFLGWARGTAGNIRYGTLAPGSERDRVTIDQLAHHGISAEAVVFPDTKAMVAALNRGEISMLNVPPINTTYGFRYRPLVALSDIRVPGLDTVPSALELGLPIRASEWGGLVAPKGLPSDIRSKLEGACKEAIRSSGYTKRAKEIKSLPTWRSGEEFQRWAFAEYKKRHPHSEAGDSGTSSPSLVQDNTPAQPENPSQLLASSPPAIVSAPAAIATEPPAPAAAAPVAPSVTAPPLVLAQAPTSPGPPAQDSAPAPLEKPSQLLASSPPAIVSAPAAIATESPAPAASAAPVAPIAPSVTAPPLVLAQAPTSLAPPEPVVQVTSVTPGASPFSSLQVEQRMTRRRALVIGNNKYQNVQPLANAAEDASSMAESLREIGYEVTLRLDLSERDMKLALRTFRKQLQGGDEALFFFAGHGVQLGMANYLLPVDITGESEAQIKDDAIPLQRVLDDMAEQRVRFTLAIIDACRDNPFKSRGRAIGERGLGPTTAATGQMIIFSAGAGQRALDNLGPGDKSRNGLFTRVLLKKMQEPGISVDRLVRSVRTEVVTLAKAVGHEQVPAIYDQVIGDFYFRQPAGTGK